MNFIKKNKRIIIFIIITFIQIFYLNTLFYDYDATWEYGLCHAFVIGEVPYIDFNLITTPLFVFLFSIGLFIKDSFIVILLETFILNIIVFIFVDKVIEKKSIIYIFVLCGLCFFTMLPTYNTLSFFLLILILCFEKLNYSDKLVGFFWGLLILAKHTIGLPIVFVILVGLLINKYGLKKIFNRILFMLIPLVLFLIYLIINKSLFAFVDLCILGLFDFASNNTSVSIYFIIVLILFIYSIYMFIKDKKNYLFYYLLGSLMFAFPIFDKSHISYFVVIFIFICCCNGKFNTINNKKIILGLFCLLGICYLFNRVSYEKLSFSNLKHYDYIYLNSDFVKYLNSFNKKLDKYENYYLIDEIGMFYDIVYDRNITFYGLPHYGNFGYDGVNKFIKMIDADSDNYFIIKNETDNRNQFVIEIVEYITNNYKKVDSFYGYEVYYKD